MSWQDESEKFWRTHHPHGMSRSEYDHWEKRMRRRILIATLLMFLPLAIGADELRDLFKEQIDKMAVEMMATDQRAK